MQGSLSRLDRNDLELLLLNLLCFFLQPRRRRRKRRRRKSLKSPMMTWALVSLIKTVVFVKKHNKMIKMIAAFDFLFFFDINEHGT